ncbi:hypothetical protein OCU04_001035 [Sclerotinia nivalis]|uniref:Integral membrane protein n=1 Tax=Sclerotinia nivalis TaxID=352851 RepID=A0A9X0AXB1_9HELO|nr:hypothetical protein OCU04_001035 [Sclerotinia nivalis]
MTFQFHLPLNHIDAVNQPPIYFLQVQDALILTTGILWTVAYVLYIKQANQDESYGMPLIALCANIGWELIYGVFYPLSFAETITFVPWLLVDAGIWIMTLRYGPQQWKQAPLVANNLSFILIVGTVVMVALHWAFINTYESVFEAAFWSGFVLQTLLGTASIAHLMSRNNTSGHSLTIWFCRWIGSAAAVVMFSWRYAHYPADYKHVGTPMATVMFTIIEMADITYPFVYAALDKTEKLKTK